MKESKNIEQSKLWVRSAREADCPALGFLHYENLVASLEKTWGPAVCAPLLATLNPQEIQEGWRYSLAQVDHDLREILVALDGEEIVGLLAFDQVTSPGQEALSSLEIVAFEVAAGHQNRGHGSRLLAAATDMLKSRGVKNVHIWVQDQDLARADFLKTTGFSFSGRSRKNLVGDLELVENYWHSLLQS